MNMGVRLLNVDDNPAQRYVVTRTLKEAGFEVTEAATGEQALQVLPEARPALVLLDVHLPGLSGFEVCRRIKEDPSLSDILVLQVSGIYTGPEERLRGLEGGADGYLAQPYEARELVALIRTLLRLRQDPAERLAIIRREQEARALAEAARNRIEFLAHASEVLSSNLQYEQTLERVAGLAVPRMADLCIIDLVQPGGRIERSQIIHAFPMDPALLARIEQAQATDDDHGVAWCVRTQEPVLVKEANGGLAALTPELDRELGVRSFIQVPMRLHGRCLGAITWMFTRSDRRYRDDDLGLAADLASRAAAAIENARLYREARRASQVRDDMLAMVSHDLRSPLGTIAMSAERILRDGGSGPRAAAAIQRAAGQMTRLIDDLLDVSSIERGKLSVELQQVDVGELLAELAGMFEPVAAAAQVKLRIEAPEKPLSVFGDRARLLQILDNLLGNAIKFTPHGGQVTVTVAADGRRVHFTVADTGIGIAPEHQDRLFDPFWQARDDRRGKGLGLYIARGLVNAHGGTMSIDSRPGGGTRISFTVPLAP